MFFMPPDVPTPIATVIERESHYAIQARDEPGLVKEMNEKGPASIDGSYWGYTFSSQSYRYDTRMNGATCGLVKPEVHVSINIVYPAWTPPANVRPAVTPKWARLWKAMHRHEQEHAALSRMAAAELVALMTNHPTDVSCEALDAYLQGHAKVILDRMNKANADLDERTRHGSTEGVAISW